MYLSLIFSLSWHLYSSSVSLHCAFAFQLLAEVKSCTDNLHPTLYVWCSLLDWRLGDDLGLVRLLTALDSVLKLLRVFEVCAISLQIQPLLWQLLWCHPVSLALQEKLF